MNSEVLSNAELLQLYACYKDMELYYLNKEDEYLKIYLTNSTLIVAAWAYVLFEQNFENLFLWHFILFTLPILLMALSLWFSKLMKKAFNNEVEIVAQASKIEDLLNLHDAKLYGGNLYWKSEGIIHKRHLDYRKKCKKMSGFVSDYFDLKGTLFKMFKTVNFVIIMVSILLTIISLGLIFY